MKCFLIVIGCIHESWMEKCVIVFSVVFRSLWILHIVKVKALWKVMVGLYVLVKKCALLKKQARRDVELHLCKKGFVEGYKYWFKHGEAFPCRGNVAPVSTFPIVNMVMDVVGPEFDSSTNEEPHGESQEFYELLRKTEESLWPSCKNYIKLSVVSELLALKINYNMIDSCFDSMIGKIKKVLPENHELLKKMMRKMGLAEVKLDACSKHHILYYKEHEDKLECPECHEPYYKSDSKTRVPQKVLRYFPLASRLKGLYYCREIAKDMLWHADHTQDTDMEHPCDTECWQVLKESFPSFAVENCNVVVSLSATSTAYFGCSTQSSFPFD